jgi:pimeloyl-ACP methyl ester carboxylesterase
VSGSAKNLFETGRTGYRTRRHYRVVAPDQIGFGKSSKPAAYQFSFQQLASNTRSLLNALRIVRVAVVGI